MKLSEFLLRLDTIRQLHGDPEVFFMPKASTDRYSSELIPQYVPGSQMPETPTGYLLLRGGEEGDAEFTAP